MRGSLTLHRRVRTSTLLALAVLLPVVVVARDVNLARATGSPVNWTQVASGGPAARCFQGMAYDSSRGRTVMFGGADGNYNAFGDTWEWDGNAWQQAAGMGSSPPARYLQAMVYDSGRHRTVIFGGFSSYNTVLGDTWEWDGLTWRQQFPTVSPPAGGWSAAAYDSRRGRTVLFGGSSSGGTTNQTWEYDGSTWTQVFPAHSPTPRTGARMAYDSARGVSVLYGGHGNGGNPNDSGRLADTWEWDGSDWLQRNPATTPWPRFEYAMAYDSQRSRTVLFGGDFVRPYALGWDNETWEWDGVNWVRDWPAAAPSPRFYLAMAYDSVRGRMVLFGGDGFGYPHDVFFDDTWELGTGIVTPPGSPAVTIGTSTFDFGQYQTFPVGAPAPYPLSRNLFSSGTGPLVFTATTTGDFSVTGLDCPSSPDPLAAGSYCTLLVTFTPTAAGDRYGSIVITFNGSGSPITIPAHGVGQMSPSTTKLGLATGVYGGSASLNATVTSNGNPAPGLSVDFSLFGSPVGSAQTDSHGVAVLTAPLGSMTPGTYVGAVTASFGGNAGYFASSAVGDLVVNPAPLVVTANDATRWFGSDNPVFSASYSGFAGSDGPSSLSGQLALTTDATAASPVGQYRITPSGLSSSNYSITFVPGTLAVTPIPVSFTVTAGPLDGEGTIEFSDRAQISTTVSAADPRGGVMTGTVTMVLNGIQIGPVQTVTSSGQTVTTVVSLDAALLPNGQGNYSLSAMFSSSNPNYASSTAARTLTVSPETGTLAYAGDLLVVDSVTPLLSATIDQRSTASEATFIDFTTLPVWVRFDITGPGVNQSVYIRAINDVDWSTSGKGLVAGSGPLLPDGGYTVTAHLVDGPGLGDSRFLAGQEALGGIASSPAKGGFLAGAGTVTDPSGTATDSRGHFGFEMKPGPAVTGNLAYSYRTRVDVGGGVLRDVDIVVTSSDVTSLTGNQTRASANGHASVAAIDALTGVHYSSLEFTGGAFSLNVTDGSPDTFGLTVYRPDRSVFHAAGQKAISSGSVVDHL